MSARIVRAVLSTVLLAATSACVTTSSAGASADAGKDCEGAAAMVNGCTVAEDGPYTPTADEAGSDYRGNGNKEGCWTDLNFKTFKSCTFGSKKAKYTVALVGNSHMAQYLKSFTNSTQRHDLRIVTFLIPQCFATEARIDFSGRKDPKGLSDRCYEWGQWAQRKAAALDPDLIVTSERTYRDPVKQLPEGKHATWVKGYRDYLAPWIEGGHRVTVIRDNPVPEYNVPECLTKNPKRYSKCAGRRDRWLPPDPVVQAAQSFDSKLVDVIDMTRYMCDARRCPAVLGGLTVYRDHSHMSGTWIASLERFFVPAFMKVLGSNPE
ncbi:MAG: SGNH hydrolase domain-containing protein [Sporichthyaceae bacterium]